MQYLTTRNMSSITTPKMHKTRSPNDTPWMQSSTTNMTDPYYSHNLSSGASSDNSESNSTYPMNEFNVTIDQHNNSNGKSPDGKPPYSYATLIKYAIERSAENKLTLSQIYQWVIDHYPYYGTAGSGWKNSIRHNLSLNKSFVRVPRPVNEPGKGSYWTVDQYAAENEHNVRSTVRGRSGRSSSDSSLHRANNNPWLYRNSGRYYRDGRSLSNDADTSSGAAACRSSQYGYYSHPYGSYDRNFSSHPYGYPTYHYPQRMPSHETLLSARQHSSVTYSLPASATAHNQQPQFNNYNNTTNSSNNMYLGNSPFYSHRQSCPDLTNIPSATYSETNMLPNFNSASAASTEEACLQSSSSSSSCDNKPMYSSTQYGYASEDSQTKTIDPFGSSSSSPLKQTLFMSKKDSQPGLPSPILSSSTSPSSSSQHLSMADPLTMVTQPPSPIITRTAPTSGTRIASIYSNFLNNTNLTQKENDLSSSSSLTMNDTYLDKKYTEDATSQQGSPQLHKQQINPGSASPYISSDENFLQDEDIVSQNERFNYHDL